MRVSGEHPPLEMPSGGSHCHNLSAREAHNRRCFVANSRLEGHDLPAEDLELARAYLSGEIDAATYQARVRRLVEAEARRAESA
jgi:hypothetical protein